MSDDIDALIARLEDAEQDCARRSFDSASAGIAANVARDAADALATLRQELSVITERALIHQQRVADLEAQYEFARAMIAYAQEEEREACAKLCEAIGKAYQWTNEWQDGHMFACDECATTIRARGGK
jgi:hypothetical protein